MFWIELIIVLAIIFIGVRVGGTFLAMAGGIGMFIMTFILHVTPSDPPITVILIMILISFASFCCFLFFCFNLFSSILKLFKFYASYLYYSNTSL